MNGEEGKAVTRVRAFGEKLRAELSDEIRWHEVDERHTTSDAMAKLHDAGRNEKNSRGIIDQAAAVEILQRWLDDRAGPTLVPEWE
jgi:putative Holliday junction resolvase